jgi:signal transduction histidine kinase
VTSLVGEPGDERRPVVAVVQPFRRPDGAYYLVSEMNPSGSAISAFLADLGAGGELRVAVVDEHGAVVASPDARILFRPLPQADAYASQVRSHRALVTPDLPAGLTPGAEGGEAVLTAVAPLEFAPWGVVVQEPVRQALAAVHGTRWALAAAGVILVVVGGLVSRALWKSLVTPIRHLSRQAERVRAGDLATPITVAGDWEVEVLGRTLDEARARLASTLAELRTLNETLEAQVAARTRQIEARYRDLTLLHAVAQLSSREHEPDRLLPEMLGLIAAHHGFGAAAIVTHPAGRPAATYVVPRATALPWLGEGGEVPAGWQRREILHGGRVEAELYHPRDAALDEQVMGALEHQLAASLHGAALWVRTREQDAQRQGLVRRLLHAAEDERRRLARELHDETSQLLTVVQLSLERVEGPSPELDKAKQLLVTTQADLHRIIYDLRPSLLDDLGLSAAITSHAQDHLVRQGLQVSLEIEQGLPLRPEIETTMFRIYQELATNILRHAHAEHVSLELYERDGRLVLAVEDDGVGFDPTEKSAGAGITGMRERAALVNGTLRIDSERDLGTHVVLEIPVR